MNQLALFVLKQAVMALGLGGAAMTPAGSQDSCDPCLDQNVTVGRRTESRPYRDADAATPYWITQKSGCKQPCPPDYWMYKTIRGRQVKVYARDVEVIPKSTPQETGCATKSPGDYWAYRTDGRRQVRVWMHDEPVDRGLARSEGVNPCCRDCSCRSDALDERLERRGYCVVEGRRADCTANPPECPDCATRTRRTHEEARP